MFSGNGFRLVSHNVASTGIGECSKLQYNVKVVTLQ